jgi:hypothetical protein
MLIMTGLLLSSVLVCAEPATQPLQGRLVIPPGAGTKNSYLTGNFQLLTRDARLILTPSRQVSNEQMSAFQDRFVTVQAIYVPEQKANPDEQAPMEMGPDGFPALKAHPACYRVMGIKAYEGAPFPVVKP